MKGQRFHTGAYKRAMDAAGPDDDYFLHVNIGGTNFSFITKKLEKYPDTFLAKFAHMKHKVRMKRCDGFVHAGEVYYFDRNPELFRHIAQLYWTGVCRPPYGVCVSDFARELVYWRVSRKHCKSCNCCPGLDVEVPELRTPSADPTATGSTNDRTESPATEPPLRPTEDNTGTSTPSQPEELPLVCLDDSTDPDSSDEEKEGTQGTASRRRRKVQDSLTSLHPRIWWPKLKNMDKAQVWMELNRPNHCVFTVGAQNFFFIFHYVSLLFICLSVIIMGLESSHEHREEYCRKGLTPHVGARHTVLARVSQEVNNSFEPGCAMDNRSYYAGGPCDIYFWCSTNVLTDLNVADIICLAWFTVEFAAFAIAAPRLWRFLVSPVGILDILSIVPMFFGYFELMYNFLNGSPVWTTWTSMRVQYVIALKCLRAVRILKLAQFSKGLHVIGRVFRDSWRELLLVAIYTFIVTAFFGFVTYYSEIGGGETAFDNVLVSLWWSIVTVTTLGYGDIVPTSVMGKVVASILAMMGLCFMGMPVSIISDRFGVLYHEVVPSTANGQRQQARQGSKLTRPAGTTRTKTDTE